MLARSWGAYILFSLLQVFSFFFSLAAQVGLDALVLRSCLSFFDFFDSIHTVTDEPSIMELAGIIGMGTPQDGIRPDILKYIFVKGPEVCNALESSYFDADTDCD